MVITVDTSVAHLAGAMGKPVWLMMHTEGSWHWMADRDGAPWQTKSPWYPSVRIFRQKRAFEWDGVVGAIAQELQRKIILVA
jgi:ADP-heptose:LPS heptosyltransferase